MKTIEEAIDQAIQKFLAKSVDDSLYNKDEVCDLLCDFSKHITSLPLAERLTAEEREKIKGAFAMFLKFKEKADLYERKTFELGYYQGILRAYCDIFGKSMFAEEGE